MSWKDIKYKLHEYFGWHDYKYGSICTKDGTTFEVVGCPSCGRVSFSFSEADRFTKYCTENKTSAETDCEAMIRILDECIFIPADKV